MAVDFVLHHNTMACSNYPLTADMIKNGFLQQSAFDDIDQFSVPEKQFRILFLIMDFYDDALQVIKQGCPLLKIISLDARNEIIRAKSTVPNNDLTGLSSIEKHLKEQMSDLERTYRRDATE